MKAPRPTEPANGKPSRLGMRARAALWIILPALAAGTLWFAVLPQRFASTLTRAVEQETGLGIAIAGRGSMVIEDGLQVRFSDVRIANAQTPAGLLIDVKELTVPAHWGGFFGSTPGLSDALGDGAIITLDLGAPLRGAGTGKAGAATADQPPAAAAFRLRLKNASLNLQDPATGFRLSILDANGLIARDSENGVLLHLTGLLNGIYTTIRIEADDANRLFNGGSPADVLLSSDNGELRFSGRAGWKSGLALDGRLSAATRRTAELMSWLGLPNALLPDTSLELDSAFSARSSQALLSDLALKSGRFSAKGNLSIAWQLTGLSFDGVLNADDLFVGRFWQRSAGANGWSDAPFRWLPAASANGRLQINARNLNVSGWMLKDSQTLFALDEQGAQLNVSAESGKTSLLVTASRQSPPSYVIKAKLADAPAGQVLAALTAATWLRGTADFTLDATSSGDNLASAVSSLAGTAALTLAAGAVSGYSMKDLLAGGGTGWRAAQGDQTSGLGVALQGKLADGIVMLEPARVKADGLDATATGEIDLLRQALDLRVDVQGGKSAPKAAAVSGSWYEPEFGDANAQSGQQPQSAPSAN